MKTGRIVQPGNCTVDEEKYAFAVRVLQLNLRSGARITNRELRALTGITYDQAIQCLARMCAEGLLQRRGRAGGVHYIRLDESVAQPEDSKAEL